MTIQDWLGENNKLGIDIWEKKYRYGDETFDEWLDRVSGGKEDVKKLIREKKFLFGGRILANRGLDKKGIKACLSNCFVITPPDDNIESIFDCAKKMARTYSAGGGCGVDIGNLAPRGAKVHNTAKESTGAVSFMDLFSTTTGTIGQSGRRGALMISLPCTHPDLEEFIDCKTDLNRVTKANISVRVTDKFMQAVKDDAEWEMSFTRPETGETITKKASARKLFRRLCENNWDYGEPGMLFWDRIREYNMLCKTPEFEFAGVNPCAEEPLPAGGSCLLGSMNLAEYVDEKTKLFQLETFHDDVQTAVLALNDVLDEGIQYLPLEEQKKCVEEYRQIGLGIMGLADMLIKMGVGYDTDRARRICSGIASEMSMAAIRKSCDLAAINGSYLKCDPGKITKTQFFNENFPAGFFTKVLKYGLRNSQLLTCAPTGTLSTMLGVSGGIEPIFANYYERRTQSLYGEDVTYKVYTPIVEKFMRENGIKDDKDLPPYFVTAQTIDPMDRIEMQSVWQDHIDASISSTVNLPNEATVDDVEKIYMKAWKRGLKGITVFRAGCKRAGILTTDSEKKKEQKEEKPQEQGASKLEWGDVIVASNDVIGKKRKLTTGCGSLHCTAFFDPSTAQLCETYFSKGSSGGCNSFMIGLSRMISLAARTGCDVPTIVDQLLSCTACPSYAVRHATKGDTSAGSCCPGAIGNALLDMWNEMKEDIMSDDDIQEERGKELQAVQRKKQTVVASKCPECGEALTFEGGCNICKNCGWSHCG